MLHYAIFHKLASSDAGFFIVLSKHYSVYLLSIHKETKIRDEETDDEIRRDYQIHLTIFSVCSVCLTSQYLLVFLMNKLN